MNYSAAHNADTQGQRIDMTNWATLYLPLSSAPHVNISALGGGNPLSAMFRPGFDKKDSKLVNPPRSVRPWKSVEAIGHSAAFITWVRGHLSTKVTWM